VTDETRRRFLLAIADQVAPERVEEVRVFRPIRQGGQETGVAVVAVEPEALADGAESPSMTRHVVYSARYRLVLKGPIAAAGKLSSRRRLMRHSRRLKLSCAACCGARARTTSPSASPANRFGRRWS
jgi:hypothetical protein